MIKVAVILSTYNGEKYLEEQLNSILDQSFNEFKIFIRDDGSSDNTIKILNKYSLNFPDKILLFEDKKGNIGVKKSFDELLFRIEAKYYLFSDQDDIWEKNKIETLVQYASVKPCNAPFLVFSEMNIVDGELENIEPLFYNNIVGMNNKRLERGFFRGSISGCLMLFNNIAKNNYFKFNVNKTSHDYHMFMITYILGNVYYDSSPLVKHRIHSTNVVGLGSNSSRFVEIKDLIKYFLKSKKYRKIRLNSYFNYINKLRENQEINEMCIKKSIYNDSEIAEMSYLCRKKWYYTHFFTKERGLFRELIRLIII